MPCSNHIVEKTLCSCHSPSKYSKYIYLDVLAILQYDSYAISHLVKQTTEVSTNQLQNGYTAIVGSSKEI